MKKYDIQKACVRATNFINHNSTNILTGFGIIGVVTTAVLTAKAVPKAQALLDDKEEFKMQKYGEELTKFEKFITVVPAYFPAILMGTATIACIAEANHINNQRQAMLTSAYAYLNSSYREYRNKVAEIFGDDKESAVREAIAKDKLREQQAGLKQEEGTLTLYDEYGGRYFEITPSAFNDALYQLNKMYNFTGEMTLNNFYEFFDLPPIPGGNILGWSALKDYECCGVSWIDVSLVKIEMVDNMQAYVMQYNVDPSDDYGCWVTRDWQ